MQRIKTGVAVRAATPDVRQALCQCVRAGTGRHFSAAVAATLVFGGGTDQKRVKIGQIAYGFLTHRVPAAHSN